MVSKCFCQEYIYYLQVIVYTKNLPNNVASTCYLNFYGLAHMLKVLITISILVSKMELNFPLKQIYFFWVFFPFLFFLFDGELLLLSKGPLCSMFLNGFHFFVTVKLCLS